jgi:RNA polymerase sigma-70 factor, ECF subfamily
MPDELQLLKQARQGNAAALDELLARHQKQVLRFGLQMCGNEDDAREVLQETLLAAFRKLHHFRGEARLSTWLYQIARSFCAKTRRRSAGEPARTEPLERTEAASLPSETAAPDESTHAREMAALLQSALLSLPEAYREVIVLRDVEGLSAEEAAKVLGVAVGALKSRLHRARAGLRQQLGAAHQ